LIENVLKRTLERFHNYDRFTTYIKYKTRRICNLRVEYRLGVFENSVLIKIFGPKKDEISGKVEKTT